MRWLVFFCGLMCAAVAFAPRVAAAENGRYRVSILTGGPGEELWETFGHACIRVIDSAAEGQRHDLIYNYGFFDAANGSIGYQFLTGRVKVFLDTITFRELQVEYTDKRRDLYEQELLLTPAQSAAFARYLEQNLKPQNRYYEYDAFFDNCTTRLRDALHNVLGSELKMGKAVSEGERLTFRDVSITPYCSAQRKPWFGLGLHLSYGANIDREMTDWDAMFLPELLANALSGATLHGRPLAANRTLLMKGSIAWQDSPLPPVPLAWGIAVLCCIGLVLPVFYRISRAATSVLVVFSGILGTFLAYTWLIDGEPAWNNNLNVLWAVPFNLVFFILPRHFRPLYGRAGLGLIALALVAHIAGIQRLPLQVVAPVMLACTLVFAGAARGINSR